MKTVYPAIFTQVKSSVLVEVPDLAILTEGTDIASAIDMARDAIGLNCTALEDDNCTIPQASALADIDPQKGTFAEEGTSFVSMVDIDLTAYRRRADNKMIRRNVTIPAWMDKEATKAKINVSKCLQNALEEELQQG